MSLLRADHGERRKSAALSLAANRVSKIDKVARAAKALPAPHGGLTLDSAVRSADSLLRDVCEYIANGETLTDPRHAQELANMATCARDRLDEVRRELHARAR